MKEYIGKNCLINISLNNKILVYTAIIISATDTHISFIDKFNERYTFRIENVVEIKEIK